MTIKLGVVMDPIGSIQYKKDTTLAMLWEAQARGWAIYYFEQKNLFLRDGVPYGDARLLSVSHDPAQWVQVKGNERVALAELDVILMRKDPPFNEEYIYTTYILEYAERFGTLIVNRAQSLRDANEKFFATYFPDVCPPNIVTRSVEHLRAFWEEWGDVVCKPLNTMGGVSVFRLQKGDVNANVIFETLTNKSQFHIMAQKYIPEIKAGDKRILLIDGEPFPHALTRIPQGNDWRGNLAVGAKGVIKPLSERDYFICHELSDEFKKRGLYFVGIDVIGDYLTEINVTSPTGIRELDDGLGTNISAQLFDIIEGKIRLRIKRKDFLDSPQR